MVFFKSTIQERLEKNILKKLNRSGFMDQDKIQTMNIKQQNKTKQNNLIESSLTE